MIDRKCAEEIRGLALQSVEALSGILAIAQGQCSAAEYQRLRKGVGHAIGPIETDILAVVYADYPELDDLT